MNQLPPVELPPLETIEKTPATTRAKRFWLPKNKVALALLIVLCLTGLLSLGYAGANYLFSSTTQKSDELTASPQKQPIQPDSEDEDLEDTPKPSSSPAGTPPSAAPSSHLPRPPYIKNALVIQYFPLTSDKKRLDSAITGDVSDSYEGIRRKTASLTANLLASIRRSTSYRGYKQPTATPSIDVTVYKTFEHTEPYPYINNPLYPTHPTYKTPEPKYKIDYQKILTEHSICTYVTKHNVSQVYIWAYSGYGSATGEIRGWESNMSGPYGNISNSYRENDMPYCGKTYVVYVLNYGRGTAEALHSWGHQIEREMAAVNPGLYMAFRGPEAAGLGQSGVARCGSVHHPPNSTEDYDYANPKPYTSDCLSGALDSAGKTSRISCKVWGCNEVSDTNNPHLNYQIWMWQNLPGYGNAQRYQGKSVTDMWYYHADFDKAMAAAQKMP